MRKSESGQTLIEFVVALGAAVAVLSAISGAVLHALNNAGFAKNQNLANQYSAQGMEIVRKIRTSSPMLFSTLGGSPSYYCLDGKQTTLSSPADLKDLNCKGCGKQGSSCSDTINRNIDNFFAREVDIESPATDCTSSANLTKVTVNTSWIDSKCPSSPGNPFCHSVKLVSCMLKTQAISTP